MGSFKIKTMIGKSINCTSFEDALTAFVVKASISIYFPQSNAADIYPVTLKAT